MIDWLTAVVPIRHKRINNGHVINVDSDGFERWVVPVARQLEGSFESSMQFKSNNVTECLEYADHLYFTGNPTKFLQGHNIIGIDDINLLTLRTLEFIAPVLGITVDAFTRKRIMNGMYFVKRIDINYSYELPSLSDVRAFIDAMTVKAKTRHGRATVKRGTFYFGQHSRRWSVKGYSKYDEIMEGKKGHRLPPHLLNSPLLGFSENKIRLELVLRAPELKKLTNTDEVTALQLTELGISNIFNDYLSRLDMTANVSLKDEALLTLPGKLQGTYALWRQGYDVRSMLPNGTFYRHYHALKAHQIDISLPFDTEDNPASNVVPLIRVLDAKPVAIPAHLKLYLVQ